MNKEVLRISHMFHPQGEEGGLDDFSMNLYEGEVLGLMGYRNSGKSVLFDILAGKEGFCEGTLFLNEEVVSVQKMPAMKSIVQITGRPALLDNMSVADNIFHLRKHGKWQIFTRQKMHEKLAERHLKEFGLELRPETPVYKLSALEKSMVEMVKAYILGGRILLLYDIVNNRTREELLRLRNFFEQMKRKGVSFFMSGYQIENLRVCSDRILIMSRGRVLKLTANYRENHPNVAKILEPWPVRQCEVKECIRGEVLLEAEEISTDKLNDFSFSISRGEIVAVIDYERSTNEALYQFLQEPGRRWRGSCRIYGREYTSRMAHKSVVFIDFNNENTVIPYMSLEDNLCMGCFGRFSEGGFINRKRMEFVRREFLEWDSQYSRPEDNDCFGINARDQMAIRLFGLRLQKPDLVLCMDPFTADLGSAGRKLKEVLEELAARGSAVLLLSGNLEQGYMLADRFLIVQNGSVRKSAESNEF